MYFILLCRSNDAVTGTQDKDLEEVDKDCVNNERTGMPNGPVADVDTLEIGITKKEMGELLNCKKHNTYFIFHQVITVVKTIRVYSNSACLLMIRRMNNGSLLYQK
jgi:hypothetical protein